MGLTAAQRQRRSRAHKADDHRFCDPLRCAQAAAATAPAVTSSAVTDPAVTAAPAVTPTVTPSPPVLDTRGRRLWQQTLAQGPLTPGEVVLLEEACRLADRCDRLDALLRGQGREWISFASFIEGGEADITVIVDKALTESRQQALALRQVLGDLARARAAGRPAAPAPTPAAPAAAVVATGPGQTPAAAVSGGGGVADLTARIAAKRGQAPTG